MPFESSAWSHARLAAAPERPAASIDRPAAALDRPAHKPPLSPAELAELTRQYAEELAAGPATWQFDAESRWHRRIHRDDQVDVWLISWLPSQGTQLHDHGGSSGAFTVIDGVLDEAQISGASGSSSGDGVVLHERDRVAGCTVLFGPRYVHDVRNTSSHPAVSVHAYSPPLTLMRYYDIADGALRRIGGLTPTIPSSRSSRTSPARPIRPMSSTAPTRSMRRAPPGTRRSTTCSRTRAPASTGCTPGRPPPESPPATGWWTSARSGSASGRARSPAR